MTRARALSALARVALAAWLAAACGPPTTARPSVMTPPVPAVEPAPAPEPVEPAPVPEKPELPPPPELAFPGEDFRSRQPDAGPVRPFKPTAPARFKLGNGVEVFLVERHELPTISMQLVFEGGSKDDPVGKEGRASMCIGLMSEGTQKLDKIAFAEALADIASSVSSFAGLDQQGLFLSTLTRNLDPTLELFADTLLRPGLRQDELDRAVKQRLNSLKQLKGSVAGLYGRLLGSVVYGEKSPLARFPTEASVPAISLADCKQYVADAIKPAGARLFVVGDITRAQIEEKVTPRLAGWKGKPKAGVKVGKLTPRNGKIFFVDVPGAAQSQVGLVGLGPARKAKDYFATDVMAGVLGGDFSSRINMNIREKHGYAYGAYGGFRYHRYGSMLVAGGSVKADVTKESIQELLKELRAIRDGDVTDDELGRQKSGSILGLPGQFATGRAVLSTYQSLLYFGLPLGYYDAFIGNVQAVSKAQVRKAAQQHVKPDDLRILVVGDAKTVLPKLQELLAAKELTGDLVILDPDGKPIPQK